MLSHVARLGTGVDGRVACPEGGSLGRSSREDENNARDDEGGEDCEKVDNVDDAEEVPWSSRSGVTLVLLVSVKTIVPRSRGR